MKNKREQILSTLVLKDGIMPISRINLPLAALLWKTQVESSKSHLIKFFDLVLIFCYDLLGPSLFLKIQRPFPWPYKSWRSWMYANLSYSLNEY